MNSPKFLFTSKTVLVNLAIAVIAFVPQLQTFVREHPQLALQILAAVGLGLRLITKGRVRLYPGG